MVPGEDGGGGGGEISREGRKLGRGGTAPIHSVQAFPTGGFYPMFMGCGHVFPWANALA